MTLTVQTDSERLTTIGRELAEVFAHVQVLKSAVTPPAVLAHAEPSYMLAPLVAAIDAHLRAALEVVENS